MSSVPSELRYTESHEWVRVEGDVATVGITDFAQEQLGDLTFVDLPKVGAALTAGTVMGSVESVKAAADVYAPVSGQVLEVNESLESDPGAVNREPYGAGWLVKVKVAGLPETLPETLLDAATYEKTMAACAH